MRVISLASGSSGNCYLIQVDGYNVLIDCGLTATNLKKYLADYGVRPAELSAIFLTHEHSDHVRSAGIASRAWGVPVIANEKTLTAARYRWQKVDRLEEQRAAQLGTGQTKVESRYNTEVLRVGEAKSFGPLEISSFPVSHDANDTVCYTFRAENQQGVILTDLGCATSEIFEPLNASQLIILEANHDLQQLRQSRYPASLKARISSNVGHLSNAQSADILQKVLQTSGYSHRVWLAHLSETNNSPDVAKGFIYKWLDRAGLPPFKLEVAGRDQPSLDWDFITSASTTDDCEVAERDRPNRDWDSQPTFFQTQMVF